MLPTVEVYLRVPETMVEAVAALAAAHNRSRSAVLVRALELYLAEHTDWRPRSHAGLP